MQKKGLTDNRNWFVFIVCSVSTIVAVLGALISSLSHTGKEAVNIFVGIFNISFILFWIIVILAEKKVKRLHQWLSNEETK